MSNETKIGILAVVATAILIWGYKFLKGQNILTSSTLLYTEYQQVEGLQASSDVIISGFKVGVVSDIYLKPEDMKTIVVVMNIDRGVDIPKDTRAEIISTSLMGGKAIALKFDSPCSGADCVENGDYLRGTTQGFLESVVGDPSEFDSYISSVTSNLGEALDTLSNELSDPNSNNEIAKTFQELQAVIRNLNATTASLNRFINASAAQMNGVLSNMNSISENIASSNDDVKKMLANMASFSGELDEMDLSVTIKKANKTLDGSTAAIDQLNTTLQSTDKAVGQLGTMVNKMKNGEGTMGKLLGDEELYSNLENSTRQLNLLLQDIRLNPKRYTRILSKKQIEYEKPENDPANKTATSSGTGEN